MASREGYASSIYIVVSGAKTILDRCSFSNSMLDGFNANKSSSLNFKSNESILVIDINSSPLTLLGTGYTRRELFRRDCAVDAR